MTAGLLAGRYIEGVTLPDIAGATLDVLREQPGQDITADLVLHAFAMRIAAEFGQAAPLLRAAVTALRTQELADDAQPFTAVGAWAALDLWDDEGYEAVLTRLDAFHRRRGALNALTNTLYAAAAHMTYAGRFAEAQAHHDEADEISAAIGLPRTMAAHRVELLAWQGREDETRATVQSVREVWGERLGYAVTENHALYSLVILELGLGRYPEALACAERVFRDDIPGDSNRGLPDLIEAAVRAGDRGAAQLAFARLAERAPAAGTPWALGQLARCRALLADDLEAEALYKESIDQVGHTSVRTDLARSHLVYGEWLRRQGRRGDAREQLRTAHDLFAVMGAAAFAERARSELQATGEAVRKRSAPADARLTPQELQVAKLAISGATNAEIATRLFVTASTVEYHLNKVFRKLGITSRRQLAKVLSTHPSQPA
jgi:DNA-binding CsgD family transcriptional regulator/uncharacterized protein YciW